MKTKHHLLVGILFISTGHAAIKAPLLKEPLIQPLSVSSWQFEFGSRYWYSSGIYKENLFGNDPGELVSRLTYENLTANSAEGFWKLIHQNGIYLKGYLGGGSISSGQLIDEDFPPGTIPYSKTVSPQKNGALSYFSADLGYNFFRALTWQLGGFIGYHYWQEQVNNFGCRQIAEGDICDFAVPLTVDILNNAAAWSSLRLGLNGVLNFSEAWHLETDIAYIHSALNENDFHNLRPDIRGILDTATGNGFQLDVILKWLLKDGLTVGAGGRWWYLATDGWAHFEQSVDAGQPQPLNEIQNRYGFILEANYQFLDRLEGPRDKDMDLDFHWAGPYLGATIGYGTNPHMVYFSPTSAVTKTLQSNNTSPASLNMQNAGFLAGGQLGYNWQNEKTILGVEGDLNYAQIGGANAATSTFPLTTTINQNIRWLSTLRARIGTLASPSMLVYLTAGAGWGGTTLAIDQRNTTMPCTSSDVCLSTRENNWQSGWTAGTGVEYAATPCLTFKAEYLYLSLGKLRFNSFDMSAEEQTSYQVSTLFNTNIVRLGINYKL